MATIRGFITDVNKKPLENVSVAMTADTPFPDILAVTNEHGEYSYENLQKGNYVLTPSKEGFQESQAKLSVHTDKEYVLNFILRRKATIATDKKKVTIATDKKIYQRTDSIKFTIDNASSDQLYSQDTQLLVTNITNRFGFVHRMRKSIGILPNTRFSFGLNASEIYRGPGDYQIIITLHKTETKEKIPLIMNFTIQ
jgi:hypothetical protein